jgi:hypothetical protein
VRRQNRELKVSDHLRVPDRLGVGRGLDGLSGARDDQDLALSGAKADAMLGEVLLAHERLGFALSRAAYHQSDRAAACRSAAITGDRLSDEPGRVACRSACRQEFPCLLGIRHRLQESLRSFENR